MKLPAMKLLYSFFFLQLLSQPSLAFLSPNPPNSICKPQRNLFPEVTSWIATIDSDIANIPENEFAPVFAGGIAVMFGGVISAFVVGTMVEKGDLYNSVIAESYGQGGENNQEFWKGISEEDRLKGMEILKELEAKKNGGAKLTKVEQEAIEVLSTNKVMSPQTLVTSDSNIDVTKKNSGKVEEIDMFSDY